MGGGERYSFMCSEPWHCIGMVVSLTLWLPCSLLTRLDAPHRRSGHLAEEKCLMAMPEIEPQNLGCPV